MATVPQSPCVAIHAGAGNPVAPSLLGTPERKTPDLVGRCCLCGLRMQVTELRSSLITVITVITVSASRSGKGFNSRERLIKLVTAAAIRVCVGGN